MDCNEENVINESEEIIGQENNENNTPKDNEQEDPEESQIEKILQRELEKDLKLIEGENDETPEQREERLQKEKEELMNLRFYKVAQQLVINPRTIYRFIRENNEILHSEGKLNMKFEAPLYISTVLETIATKLITSAVTIPNWDVKDDKLTVIRAQVAIRKFTDLTQLFSNPVLKYTSLKYMENNTIMKLKQMKLFQSQDSEMIATMNRKKVKGDNNNDNNNNNNKIKEYLGNGVIIAKIANKYFPTYVVNSDFVTFTSNILNEIFYMIIRRITQCIKFNITDNIMEKIIASLIPNSLMTEVQTAYNNVIDVFTLRELPETQQFYFIYLDGLIVKRKLKSQCDRYQSILVAVTALFEELGVIRMKHFQSDEEKNREIKQLKARWILLYNGIPISFNDTLNELGVTSLNNSIFVMEKRMYDEKRKKDVQKGYITFNDNVNKDDQKYVSEYQYQYEVAEQKTEEPITNPVESSASIALSPTKPNGINNSKNGIVMINGNYYNRKGRVLKPTNEPKYLSDDQIHYYEDKYNSVAKPTLLNLHRYIDYLTELVDNFENITNNLSVDNTTTNPSELSTLNNNIILAKDITLNNVTNAIQAYDNLFKAYQNRREYKQKMMQSNPPDAVKEDDVVVEQNEQPTTEPDEGSEENSDNEEEVGNEEVEEEKVVENEEVKEEEEVKEDENVEKKEEKEKEPVKEEENVEEKEGEKEEVKEEEKKEENEGEEVKENNAKEDEIIEPEPVVEKKEENAE